MQQDTSDQLRAAAVADYDESIVAQPAMAAALATVAAALGRIRQERLEPTDPGPARDG